MPLTQKCNFQKEIARAPPPPRLCRAHKHTQLQFPNTQDPQAPAPGPTSPLPWGRPRGFQTSSLASTCQQRKGCAELKDATRKFFFDLKKNPKPKEKSRINRTQNNRKQELYLQPSLKGLAIKTSYGKKIQKMLKSSEEINLLLCQVKASAKNALLGPLGLTKTEPEGRPRVRKRFPARYFSFGGFALFLPRLRTELRSEVESQDVKHLQTLQEGQTRLGSLPTISPELTAHPENGGGGVRTTV